jgi:hypothetical protein
MNIFALIRRTLVLLATVLHLSTLDTQAFIFSLQEQGGLSGSVNGGGGSVVVNPIGVDHWTVTVQDARIGNPITAVSLAYVEPETVGGYTAYNNVQVLSVVPGTAVFDVLSDEISPYSTIAPNGATFLIQNTDSQPIFLTFTDLADTIPEPSSAGLFFGGALLVWLRRARWPIRR